MEFPGRVGCGALLALSPREYQLSRSQLAKTCVRVLLVSLLVWCCAIPLGILSRHSPVGVTFQISLLNFAFTGVIGLFLVAGSGEHASLVQIKFLQFLGYISYGWYLVHLFVFRVYDMAIEKQWHYKQATKDMGALLARMTVVGMFSVGVADQSRKYFEEKFLRLKTD